MPTQKRIGSANYYSFIRNYFSKNNERVPSIYTHLDVRSIDRLDDDSLHDIKSFGYNLSNPTLEHSAKKQPREQPFNPNQIFRLQEALYAKLEYTEPIGIKRRHRQKALLRDLFTKATPEEKKYQRIVEKIKKEPNFGLIRNRKLPLFEVLPQLNDNEEADNENRKYINPYLIEGLKWMCLDGDSQNRCRRGKLIFDYEKFFKNLYKRKTKPTDCDVIFGSAKYNENIKPKCVGWEKSRLQWLNELEYQNQKAEQMRRKQMKQKMQQEKNPVTIFYLPFPKIIIE